VDLYVFLFEPNAEHAGDKPSRIFFNVDGYVMLGATGPVLWATTVMVASGVAVVTAVFTMVHNYLVVGYGCFWIATVGGAVVGVDVRVAGLL
jgi:hypothetical protein